MDPVKKIESVPFVYKTEYYRYSRDGGNPRESYKKDRWSNRDEERKLPAESSYAGGNKTPEWVKKIYHGVVNGNFNIDEYRVLVFYYLDTVELTRKLTEEKLTKEEIRIIDQRLREYEALYNDFTALDEHPKPERSDKFRIELIDRIFYGIIRGMINMDEMGFLLNAQVEYSRKLGEFGWKKSEGGENLSPNEIKELEKRLEKIESLTRVMEDRDYHW